MEPSMKLLHAKLDALLTKNGIKPDSVQVATPKAAAPAKLTPQQQEAINNAPRPSGIRGPMTAPRVDAATNAPTVAIPVPSDAVGPVTVETVQTIPAEQDKFRR